jgi:hypothetical protein
MKGRLTAKQAKLILHGTEEEWEEYLFRHIHCRSPNLEQYIMHIPMAAYLYARYVIKGRWPEGEPAIATHPQAAYQYARDIIRGRWPEGEAAIDKDPIAAGCYSQMLEYK